MPVIGTLGLGVQPLITVTVASNRGARLPVAAVGRAATTTAAPTTFVALRLCVATNRWLLVVGSGDVVYCAPSHPM